MTSPKSTPPPKSTAMPRPSRVSGPFTAASPSSDRSRRGVVLVALVAFTAAATTPAFAQIKPATPDVKQLNPNLVKKGPTVGGANQPGTQPGTTGPVVPTPGAPPGTPGAPVGAPPPGTAPVVPGAPVVVTPGKPGGTAPMAGTAPGVKKIGDTGSLPQFKEEIEFQPQNPNYKVQFSLEDADLPELIKVMGQLTGRRFIFGGKVRNIKATIYSPQKVTVAEAYQAFLSILETNGLTVIPSGKFLKIVETPGVVTQATPIYGTATKTVPEDRYVTRLHRLNYVTADEVANVLSHFKSRDGDITIYLPGNLLILTDTGSNIKRMMSLVEEIDVAGIGDNVWVEPIHYAGAQEIANKLAEIFDVQKGAAPPGANAAKGAGSQNVDSRITKIVAEERTNSVIIIGTEKAYLRILELIKRLDVPMSGEGEIHVLPLQHADAEELSKTLNDIVSNKGGAAPPAAPGKPAPVPTAVFEGAIRITADKSTNSLVITSSLRDYASLRNVIDKLDQSRRQVFIEAVIMDVQVNHGNKLGFSFHGGYDGLDLSATEKGTVVGGSNAAGSPASLFFPAISDPTQLQGLALGVRSNTTISLGLVGLSIPAFGVALQAVTTSADSNVLATPHIMATDNIPAEINVGDNVPLQSGTGLAGIPGLSGLSGTQGAGALGGLGGLGFGFNAPITRQNVGTKIKLIPHINDSNEVRLEVEEEISEVNAASGTGPNLTPTIGQRTAKTQLVVQDQQTIVIGGLVRDVTQNQETKVPVLGDIPLIGILFKQKSVTKQKRNLLLILTPYVIRDPADLRLIFERKMRERQEFLDHYFVFSDEKKWSPHIDYSRTRGLVEEIRQTYLKYDEKEKLEAQTKPKDIKKHEPGKPISELPPMPTGGGSYAGGGPQMPPPVMAPPPPGVLTAPIQPVGAPPTVVKPATPILKSITIEN